MLQPHDRPGMQRPPLTESPWFWIELFSIAAIIAIVLIGPKYASRQDELEREQQGRQNAYSGQINPDIEQPAAPAAPTDVRVSLQPLLAAAVVVMLFSASMLRRSRRRLQPSTGDTIQIRAQDNAT